MFGKAIMFSFFKSDSTKKLRKTYDMKLEQAMHAQRRGDIKNYSLISAEAEEIWKQIEEIQKNATK